MENGTWVSGKPDITFPYHLPEVLEVAKKGGTIFIPEGEKACDCLIEVLRTAKVKAIATTNPGGTPMSNSWHEYVKRYPDIANAKIIILPDNDDPGRKHSRTVADAILSVNPDADAKIVELYETPLPKDGYDFVDWHAGFVAEGKDESTIIETLKALCRTYRGRFRFDPTCWQGGEGTRPATNNRLYRNRCGLPVGLGSLR
jgi:DNA primase